ncbi:unnamed protein product [Lampetra fluviatilis]
MARYVTLLSAFASLALSASPSLRLSVAPGDRREDPGGRRNSRETNSERRRRSSRHRRVSPPFCVMLPAVTCVGYKVRQEALGERTAFAYPPRCGPSCGRICEIKHSPQRPAWRIANQLIDEGASPLSPLTPHARPAGSCVAGYEKTVVPGCVVSAGRWRRTVCTPEAQLGHVMDAARRGE